MCVLCLYVYVNALIVYICEENVRYSDLFPALEAFLVGRRLQAYGVNALESVSFSIRSQEEPVCF